MNGRFRFKDKTHYSKDVSEVYSKWYNSLSKTKKRGLAGYNDGFKLGLTKKQLKLEKRRRNYSSI